MHYFNIRMKDESVEKVKELKLLLKCNSNDEIFEKIVDIAYKNLKKGGKS